MPAQVDSGADRTVVPATVVEQLELTPVRKLSVAGLGGDIQLLDTYLVAIRLRELKDNVLEVLSAEHEPFVLLGRDVLNNLRIILDGPNRILEIDS
jgi:predicted aspartyl protease